MLPPPRQPLPPVAIFSRSSVRDFLIVPAVSVVAIACANLLTPYRSIVASQKIAKKKIAAGFPRPGPPSLHAPALSSTGFFAGFSGFT
jgi:hypothetical protein